MAKTKEGAELLGAMINTMSPGWLIDEPYEDEHGRWGVHVHSALESQRFHVDVFSLTDWAAYQAGMYSVDEFLEMATESAARQSTRLPLDNPYTVQLEALAHARGSRNLLDQALTWSRKAPDTFSTSAPSWTAELADARVLLDRTIARLSTDLHQRLVTREGL